MKIALIAALAEDGTIGNAGKIPWHISDDLKRFKRLTLGHPVIMGRKTFESIGKPLPGRTNIVLTCRPSIEGTLTFPDLTQALSHLSTLNSPTVFIIGGAEIYRAALPVADTLLLTHVKHPGGGDTKFPDYDRLQWREVSRENHEDYSFVEYRRLPVANPKSAI
jgi:dihydrofolate reductase